jgi:acetyl esterase/lipase
MSWLLLVAGTLGVLHTMNALSPRRGGTVVVAWSFVASWLTIELAWHHLAFGTVLTVVLVSQGALDEPAGVVGLVLMLVTGVLLVAIGVTTRTTKVAVRGALTDLEPDPDGPRFPRSHVWLPLLVNHRRGIRRVRNVEYARCGGKHLRLDVTLPSAPVPAGRARRPAIMQIHGGAWVVGDKREQGLPLLNHLAAQGWVGFNVNYRLSPGVALPEHLVDLKRGLAWIKDHAEEFGVDPDFVCVTGGSAGGHLTALMGLTANDARYQPGFETSDTSVAAAVPFYGIYDLTDGGALGRDPKLFTRFLEPIVMQAFLADDRPRFEEASPRHHVRPDAPPFFVIHGDRDTLAPVEDARTFVEQLRSVSDAPVLYAEMHGAQHAFEIFPSVRTARVIEGVERFLSTLWSRRGATTASVEGELVDVLTD